ncbi:MAG: NAD(P)/FAD-dependent oxidoreductase [Candidatus Aenigmatarchaeota archaeon]
MYDTIIIGAGIAGLTAAMYAARKGMKYEIVSSEFGGQFNVSGEVSNYPGIARTTGLQMLKEMQKQMDDNKVKVRLETAEKVEKKGKAFVVVTDKGRYDTRTVIIATGSTPRKLGVPGEKEFANKGVAYCAICDGPLFRGMDVAIVGGGNSALESVDFMEKIAKKIYVVNKGSEFAGHGMIKNVEKNKKVQIIFGADTKEIVGEKLVSGLRYEKDGRMRQIKVGGVIVAIGRKPATEAFRGLLALEEDDGHIKIDCQGRTSVPGIFAAGECAAGHEYQYVISAGQGCVALIKAARYLAGEK